MIIDHYRKLFDYTAWADTAIVGSFTEWPQVPERCRALMAHIAAAQQEWLSRVWTEVSAPPAIWPDWSAAECSEQSRRAHAAWRAFLGTLSDTDLPVEHEYRNMIGELFRTPLQDIMVHVVNHSTHHRAQCVSAAKAEGLTPPRTDYIVYVRL